MKLTIPLKYVIISAVAIGLLIAFTIPRLVLSHKMDQLEAECLYTQSTKSCTVRMRAAGHLFSAMNDLDSAEKWYKLAASAYDEEAMFHLGWLHYQRAMKWHSRDKQKEKEELSRARAWYLKSAKFGFAPAMNNLAALYIFEDPDQATAWMIKAAQKHNPIAMRNLVLDIIFGVDNPSHWKTWDPKRANPSDIKKPTLERTLNRYSPPSAELVENIRNAVTTGQILTLYNKNARNGKQQPAIQDIPKIFMKPVEASPNIPTFRDVVDDIQQGNR